MGLFKRKPKSDSQMTLDLQVSWKKIYYFARRIAAMDPWNLFQESDRFVYSDPQSRTKVYFIFMNQTLPHSVACYLGDNAYYKSTKYLFGNNWKDEPVLYLQNALVGIWGNQEDLSVTNANLVRLLNERGRGDGTWLYFQKFQEGYMPTDLSASDVEKLGDALGHLFNMLVALRDEGIPNEFAAKKQFVRSPDVAPNKFTHAFVVPDRPAINSPAAAVTIDSAKVQTLRRAPSRQFSLTMDWSYSPVPVKEGGKEYYPFVLVAVPQNSPSVHKSIEPNASRVDLCFSLFDEVVAKYGKPREVKVCDDELWSYIEPVCTAAGIKATKTKRLPAIERAIKRMGTK